MDATSIHGIPIALPPANPFAPNPMPNGDTADGVHLALYPGSKQLEWVQPHLNVGGATVNGNINIRGRTLTKLYGPVGEYGMREGLVQYPPSGTWNLQGRLVIVGPSGVEWRVFVTLGTTLSGDPARSKILSETPVLIGAGAHTCHSGPDTVSTIPFDAWKFNVRIEKDMAAEVAISVYAKYDGLAGIVLAALGPDNNGLGAIPNGFNSTCFIWRSNG